MFRKSRFIKLDDNKVPTWPTRGKSDKHRKFPRVPWSGQTRKAGGESFLETRLDTLKDTNNWIVTRTPKEPAKLTEKNKKYLMDRLHEEVHYILRATSFFSMLKERNTRPPNLRRTCDQEVDVLEFRFLRHFGKNLFQSSPQAYSCKIKILLFGRKERS